jgi:uncharacterized protein YbaA (DUF1428 family)
MIKFTIFNTGGEFALGIVKNDKQKDLLLDHAKKETLSISNTNDNGDLNVDFFEFQQIVGAYGPDVNDAKFALEEINEENEVIKEIYSTIYSTTEYNEIVFQTMMSSNPQMNIERLQNVYSEDSLIFGGYSIQKNIQQSYLIEADNFDPSFLLIATTNMDETLGDFEIVSAVYYIDNEALKIISKACDVDEDVDLVEARECLQDYFNQLSDIEESDEEKRELFSKYVLDCDFQSAGESKSLYAVLLDINGKELFTVEK